MHIFRILFVVFILVLTIAAAIPSSTTTITLPLDCRKSNIQAGIPVRRNSDGRITKVDVCGAADSGDDTFRDIPYQAQCEQFDTGQICR
jgi:Tfp pilus assembly major pilin PilA